jgi:hypothetical protein
LINLREGETVASVALVRNSSGNEIIAPDIVNIEDE